MGRRFVVRLDGKPFYCCSECSTHLAVRDDLVSEAFRGRTGTAWLFSKVVNVYLGQVEDRMMTTGLHTIADIYCRSCNVNLGWKYEQAFDQPQKYKQGKYILERDLVRLVDHEVWGLDAGARSNCTESTTPSQAVDIATSSRSCPLILDRNQQRTCLGKKERTRSPPVIYCAAAPSTNALSTAERSSQLDTPEACTYFAFFRPPPMVSADRREGGSYYGEDQGNGLRSDRRAAPIVLPRGLSLLRRTLQVRPDAAF